MFGNNPNLDLANINAHKKYGEILSIVLKILSGNQILTLIKGHNSVTNLREITGNNPNLNLVIINAHEIQNQF